MGLLDLNPFKVTNNVSNLDATPQDSAYDAIVAVVNALTNANIDPAAAIALSKLAGFPTDATKYADGSGSWSIPPGGLVYRKNSTTDLVSTTSGDLFTVNPTIAANAMGANGIVRVSAWGDYLNNTGGGQIVQIGIKFGSATGQTFGITSTTSATRQAWNLTWQIGNLGATGSQQQGGMLHMVGLAGSSVTPFVIASTPMTVDTTLSVPISMPSFLEHSNAQLSLRCHGALVQVF